MQFDIHDPDISFIVDSRSAARMAQANGYKKKASL
jgi:hypothetical protein